MVPYLELLHSIVDRLREQDDFSGPPAVLVLPEADEPDPSRPGQGDALTDQIEGALGRAGTAVIVYVESVDVTEVGADLVQIRVQVVENIVNNRSQSGTQKPSLQLIHAARSALDGWQESEDSVWSPLAYNGFLTPSKGPIMIREARFETQTFMTVDD